MGKPELGTKCTCTSCSERFYDLHRSPATCPKCGAEQPPEKPRVLRQPRSPIASRYPVRAPVPATVVDEDLAVATAADAEEEIEEEEDDAVDLDEDNDADAAIEIDTGHGKAID
jgi:uncharacterized protein (TIGR02300 family)